MRHNAEYVAFSRLSAQLDKALVEPFNPAYKELLAAARSRLVEGFEGVAPCVVAEVETVSEPDKLIRIKFHGKRDQTAYISLPGHQARAGIVERTVTLDSVIQYEGPMVNFDLDKGGKLLGIEVLFFGAEDDEDENTPGEENA